MKIWVSQDYESGEHAMWDDVPKYVDSVSGPLEISYELYEFIRESERVFQAMQDVLESLVYDWKHPESPEIDCG